MERRASLDKAFDILFSFKKENFLLSVPEISKELDIPISSCYRYIRRLCKKGLLDHDKSSNKYKLGMKLFELGSLVYRQIEIREIILPYMRELFKLTRESVFVTIINKYQGVCIEKIDSDAMLRIVIERGEVVPLHAGAAGKILMAYLPENEQDEIIGKKGLPKITSKTITDQRMLKEQLKKIRQIGYAYSDQEFQEGARALAAPIMDISGHVIGSLCIAGSVHRFGDDQMKKYTKIITEVTKKCSGKLAGEETNFEKNR